MRGFGDVHTAMRKGKLLSSWAVPWLHFRFLETDLYWENSNRSSGNFEDALLLWPACVMDSYKVLDLWGKQSFIT